MIDNVFHHIQRADWQGIFERINNSIKTPGNIIIREPVNYLKIIGRFKSMIKYIPDATEDEHELSYEEMHTIRLKLKGFKQTKHFCLFGRAATAAGINIIRPQLEKIDNLILTNIGLSVKLAGTVVIHSST